MFSVPVHSRSCRVHSLLFVHDSTPSIIENSYRYNLLNDWKQSISHTYILNNIAYWIWRIGRINKVRTEMIIIIIIIIMVNNSRSNGWTSNGGREREWSRLCKTERERERKKSLELKWKWCALNRWRRVNETDVCLQQVIGGM